MSIDLAIGIDVGFAAGRRSTGVVIVDRRTKDLAEGSRPMVDSAPNALSFIASEIARLGPSSATAGVDGSFAPALVGTKVRLVERFFMSGPFASGAGLRLCPAPTPVGSRFLSTTLSITAALERVGLSVMRVAPSSLFGSIVEIFPTMFMAAMLPPYRYQGLRSAHTDDLWLRLVGAGGLNPVPAVSDYARLASTVEISARSDLHDLRAATIAAIAADWFAEAPPGTGAASMTFIGHATELGFILPPRPRFDPAFLTLLNAHWSKRASSLPGLSWF